jgi:catechol 2,3-dioxygenase-like lactoylglutathione lyase family enzyme
MSWTRSTMQVRRAFATGFALIAFPIYAGADGLPTMRGHDHTGITVPDMSQAVSFFVDVLGCQKATAFGPFSDEKGTFMQDVLDVDRHAVINQIVLIRCGAGSNIELFSYSSPDQKVVQPRNSDVGGYHIALYVDDIKSAADYLKAKGVQTFAGRSQSPKAPPRVSRSFISRPPGDCNWRPSPIRRGWPTRRHRT